MQRGVFMRTSEDVKNEIMNEIREQVGSDTWEMVVYLLDELEEKLFDEGREYERENPREGFDSEG